MHPVVVKTFLAGCQLMYTFLPKYSLNKEKCGKEMTIREKNCHVFRGYYDIEYFNNEKNKFLVHILPKSEEDSGKITIGYFDLAKNALIRLDQSSAWCWQQGSRLRWFDDNHIMFNDCAEGQYVTRVVNVNTSETIKTYHRAFYDVSVTKRYGLSLNFSRLQRIRPGYGYSTLKDNTESIVGNTEDGIFYYDLDDEHSKLIISLAQLNNLISPAYKGEDYINHISISPNADRFMFFYIVCDRASNRTKVYLVCSDIDGGNIKVLEDKVQSSHYTWFDNDHLLVTYIDSEHGMRQGYRLYDVRSGTWKDFGSDILTLDGHPTFCNQCSIVTDTYPQKKKLNCQYLRIYEDRNKRLTDIGTFFQDTRYAGERRCDLHPALSDKTVSVDTSCFGLRSVVIFDLENSMA